jgi:hypothetical protein
MENGNAHFFLKIFLLKFTGRRGKGYVLFSSKGQTRKGNIWRLNSVLPFEA